jgi:AraC-like DNA-binding protein
MCAGLTTAETFATDVVPRSRRLTYWNDVALDTFGEIAIDAVRAPIDAQLQRRQLGELTLAQVTSTPARVHGGVSSSHGDGWFLLFNERGTGRFIQRGREAWVGPGELTALRAGESYRIEMSQQHRCIVMRLPGEPHNIDLDGHVAQRHTGDDASLLGAFMRRLTTADRDSNQTSFARLALDVVALAWPARAAHPESRSMQHWRRRAFDLVDRRVDEPDLDGRVIARELGVSLRFVHLIFASAGRTPCDFILERRLDRAARALRQNAEQSVTAVALSAGFSDLSHFCRRFRKRFGVSASRYRTRA